MLVMLLAVTRLAHVTLRKYYFFTYFIIRSEAWQVTLNWFREECGDRGGDSNGMCAEGFGVCCTCKLPESRPNPDSVQNGYHRWRIRCNIPSCIISVTAVCGEVFSENNTYFESTGDEKGICTMEICQAKPSIVQVSFWDLKKIRFIPEMKYYFSYVWILKPLTLLVQVVLLLRCRL